MLNLADFSILLMILVGPFSAFAAAHSHKAGTWSAIFFSFTGVAVGIGIGWASRKCAYATLRTKKLPESLKAVIYIFIPLLGLLAVVLATFLWAEAYYG